MRKPQALNALTVWIFASDESDERFAEVQMDNRKGSWVRNRNNEGQCDRFVKAEKSEEWMARSPVWPDDVIASETASRHQPMNWRDSIWVSDSVTQWAFPMRKATQCWVTYEREQHRSLDGEISSEAFRQCSASEYICAKLIRSLQLTHWRIQSKNVLAIG